MWRQEARRATFMPMLLPDFSPEIQFRFSRSGGKGGQNVNKVESAATGLWSPAASQVFSEEQKQLLVQKLAHRLTQEGELQIKSQTHRTQLANRDEVLKKFREVVDKALQVKRLRIASKPSKAAKEKRLDNKKQRSEVKKGRQKVQW
jgi:ribosome-associated protein